MHRFGWVLVVAPLLLFVGCGGDGGNALPSPVQPPGVPADEEYFIIGDITLLPADPAEETVVPVNCEGQALTAGQIIPFQATELEVGLIFAASADPFGDPTQARISVNGTDELRASGLSFLTANVRPADLVAPPADLSPQFTVAGFNLDVYCTNREPGTGLAITLYGSEPLDRPEEENTPQGTDDPTQKETYGVGDYLTLTSFQVETFDTTQVRFVPGSAITGEFFFVGEAKIESGGTTIDARVEVRGCFRIPAVDPPQAVPGFPGSC
jgi:hypothetical protein